MDQIYLLSSINSLPKELIDMVYEYYPLYKNQYRQVVHQLLYQDVMDELIEQCENLNSCTECDQYLGDKETYSNFRIGYYNCKFCSSYCEWSWKYDYRKMNG